MMLMKLTVVMKIVGRGFVDMLVSVMVKVVTNMIREMQVLKMDKKVLI